MKIYIGHSSEFNHQDELYNPIRDSILNSLHEIILPHEIYKEAKDFITKDIIKSCDLMIAEVSLPSTGLGIELGWANSFGRPIICIYRKGSKISSSLKVVCNDFIEYINKNDMVEKIEKLLKTIYNN